MVLFITTTCSYVIESDDLRNSLTDQQFGLNIPSYYDRVFRSTKFPRIGRSLSDTEDISSMFDANTNIEDNEENNYDNELRWNEQRSVFFPRIGKRAFHNLVWGHSLSNPHYILDAQGRYHINNGYDYHNHQIQPTSMKHYRGK
ncbi:unnamed protein product [Rotaria sordida]|uniref:Uncharacterized protein n=1 Tax=Rotaria sordida TaxID=392033 RepID=A0A814F4F4_9BILA|nr:unnamed protein product [Rotaria sordida]CAF0927596.1 unnamed protein product [Rotaria sordida]CAF0935289.1 unnamed protein product [Rotaria sordida]CAF0938657.1 unnamed protein product [Rotaria sordida]CAF0977942.1 unnamed protein product [Rotaria sordida]